MTPYASRAEMNT
jgi:hypothetical protein